MQLSKSQISESVDLLIKRYREWEDSEKDGLKLKTYSFILKGREFKIVRNNSLNSFFQKIGAPIWPFCTFVFTDSGEKYLPMEFSFSEGGIDEYSHFVHVLKEKGIFSHVGVNGYNLDTSIDGTGPRSWIAQRDCTLHDLCLNGVTYDDLKVKKGDVLVESSGSFEIPCYSNSPTFPISSISELARWKLGDFRKIEATQLNRKDFLPNEEYPLVADRVKPIEIKKSKRRESEDIEALTSLGVCAAAHQDSTPIDEVIREKVVEAVLAKLSKGLRKDGRHITIDKVKNVTITGDVEFT